MSIRCWLPGYDPTDVTVTLLTDEQLHLLVDAAVLRWAAAGLDDQQLGRLRGVRLRIADLGDDRLGQYDGRSVTLDDDAAGFGWFLDPTPLTDEEFAPAAVDHVLAALGSGPAAGKLDLLTVLMHELGHIAGLDDLDVQTVPDSLMTEMLTAGERRLP